MIHSLAADMDWVKVYVQESIRVLKIMLDKHLCCDVRPAREEIILYHFSQQFRIYNTLKLKT